MDKGTLMNTAATPDLYVLVHGAWHTGAELEATD